MADDDIVSAAGYNAYKNCSVGDAIQATAKDGTTYEGTVQKTPGGTVIAQSPAGTILEFRVLHDGPHIVLGIDGKTAFEDLGTTTRENALGVEETTERTRIKMDKIIVHFEAESQEHLLG
jgi:hypothetical protein